MKIGAAIVLGILIGWLIEWLIDWIYWRRKREVIKASAIDTSQEVTRVVEPAGAVENLMEENARLKSRLEQFINVPDDLKLIKGIGPVIERKLINAGVDSFEKLAKLSSTDLESILGEVIQRLSNEKELLAQAREFADRKNQGV